MRRRGGVGKIFNRSRRAAMSSRRGLSSPQANQRNMAQAAKMAPAKGPAQKARKALAGRANPGARQMSALEAQKAVTTRRQGMSPAAAQANQRNMAQAAKSAKPTGPAQKARKAPAGAANPGARQVSAMQAQKAAMAQAAKMAPAKGPAQKARKAPAGRANPGARQMSALEAQKAAMARLVRGSRLKRFLPK